MADALSERFGARLALPLIAAPMFQVSGVELVVACCAQGVIGSFPTANCRSLEELDAWLVAIRQRLGAEAAPFCPNLIMRRETVAAEVDCLAQHGVEMVITSVGSPAAAIGPLHEAGCMVFSDVATVRHARKAIADGADGLVLLGAGAGGQTGHANPLAFVRAVRAFFDGPLVLAGGIGDGVALRAARVLGCDAGYMGTRFIATRESMASDAYKRMLVASELDDIVLTSAFTGLPTSMLAPSIRDAGLDPLALPTDMDAEGAAALYGAGASGPRRWRDVWSAGHAVSAVTAVPTVAELVTELRHEYDRAGRNG